MLLTKSVRNNGVFHLGSYAEPNKDITSVKAPWSHRCQCRILKFVPDALVREVTGVLVPQGDLSLIQCILVQPLSHPPLLLLDSGVHLSQPDQVANQSL